MSELLDPRKKRADNEVTIEFSDGTHVIAHKEDMTVLVFDGRVPMPMLQAVQKMIEMPESDPMGRIAALGDEGKSLVDVLRNHAVKVVISPVLVLEDDGNPDHLPVGYLDIQQLMSIWQATAVVPQVGVAAAARFRPRAAADDAHAVPDGAHVPPATQPLAVAEPEREVVTG